MPRTTFIPTSDIDYLPWLEHLLANLSVELGIAEADLAKLRELCNQLRAKMAFAADAAAAAKQATADKNACRQTIDTWVRAEIRRIKARADYTEALGMHLWIVGSEYSQDLSHSSPELSGADQGGGVVGLSFAKGSSDGINIYSRRDTDSDWSLLNRATSSPYSDKRAIQQASKPELRYYRAIFVVKDQEVGQFSNELMMTCAP